MSHRFTFAQFAQSLITRAYLPVLKFAVSICMVLILLTALISAVYCSKIIIIIIITEICKAPTLRLKTMNKHNMTHIMYIEMEMLSAIK